MELSPETTQIVLESVKCLSISILGYIGLLAGMELGGRIVGYPGRGLETHEQIMKTIKSAFKKNRT